MKDVVFNKETGRHEKNGIDFDGHFLEWKLEYNPKTYLKESELSGDQWREGGEVKIYLNGDCVLNEFCRKPERALMLLAKGLHELQCHFELFGVQIDNWKEEMIGKKVHHGGIPSTVVRYVGDGEIIVKRDDGKDYLPDLYPSLLNDDDNEWGDEDRVHITDKRINWHITPYKETPPTMSHQPSKWYDCEQEGCGKCKVCEYLDFHEWVSSVRSVEDSVDRDPEMDKYLLEKYNIRA